jgi:RNA-directed DNA polymerase
MLEALTQGVKGGKWFRLIDKVFSKRNLGYAYLQVAKNKGAAGVDHVTTQAFADRLDENLDKISELLRQGTYRPQLILRTYIPKPGTKEQRPLGIPTVRDRVVQTALVNAIEPIFERDFAEHSYGFRPGRSCKHALRRVDGLLKTGYHYLVDADLKSYFDTIPHDPLMDLLRTKVADGSVLSLIEAFLKAGIMDGLSTWTPEEGAPQGAVLSPLLSNIYLDPLDHLMADSGIEMVRYADDFVILCRTAEQAERALEMVREWTEAHGLKLHPTKTKIVDVRSEGFEFLGYRFADGKRTPRPKSMKKLKDTIRGKTLRTSGKSLSCIIAELNPILRGWFAYFQHSHVWTFGSLDGWIRMRLRSILRKRCNLRGRGRGCDHQRWPNVFFAKHGLFSLKDAHALACQSSSR